MIEKVERLSDGRTFITVRHEEYRVRFEKVVDGLLFSRGWKVVRFQGTKNAHIPGWTLDSMRKVAKEALSGGAQTALPFGG